MGMMALHLAMWYPLSLSMCAMTRVACCGLNVLPQWPQLHPGFPATNTLVMKISSQIDPGTKASVESESISIMESEDTPAADATTSDLEPVDLELPPQFVVTVEIVVAVVAEEGEEMADFGFMSLLRDSTQKKQIMH